jgi:5-methylcytosine-specific restriction endonuclease McrA
MICHYCQVDFIPFVKKRKQKTCGSARCQQDYKNEWGRNNPECKTKWIENNPIKRKESSANYQKRNSAYYNSYARLYQSQKTKAKVNSLTEWDEFYIREFYDIAKRRNLEVDHIIPLTHPRVCGLHVPENLQFLTRSANAKKNNKFDEDVLVVWRSND